jgi:hypothetical protein
MHNQDAASGSVEFAADHGTRRVRNRTVQLALSLISGGFFLLSVSLIATACWADPDELIEVRRARSQRAQIWSELLQDLERPEIKRALQQADEEDLRTNLSTYRFRQAGYGGMALMLGFGAFALRSVSCVRYMSNEAAVLRTLGLAMCLAAVLFGHSAGRNLRPTDCAAIVSVFWLLGLAVACADAATCRSTADERFISVALISYLLLLVAIQPMTMVSGSVVGSLVAAAPSIGGIIPLLRKGRWPGAIACWLILSALVLAASCHDSHPYAQIGFFCLLQIRD